MPAKSITIQEDDIDERTVYSIYFKCPYCNYGNDLEWEFIRPSSCKCFRCDKKVLLKIGKQDNK